MELNSEEVLLVKLYTDFLDDVSNLNHRHKNLMEMCPDVTQKILELLSTARKCIGSKLITKAMEKIKKDIKKDAS
jgi:hypothetical protein